MKIMLSGFFVMLSILTFSQSNDTKEFRPSLSPVILAKRQVEIGNGFNVGFYNVKQSSNNYQSKYQILGNSFQITFGMASFLNIGADFNYFRATKSILASGEDFKIIYWSTTIGPRIRWSPVRYDKEKRFCITFQHSVLFPLKNSLDEGLDNSYLKNDQQTRQPTYSNQLLFMHGVGQRLIFLIQTDLSFLPKAPGNRLRPLSSSSYIYLSWLANTRLMFFLLTNYSTTFGSVEWANDPKRYYSLSSSVGFGPGIQIGTTKFSWSLSYLHPIINRDYIDQSLAIKTFNTSLRWKLEN